MAAEKGLSDIVETVRLLLERDRDVKLVVIGDGPVRPESLDDPNARETLRRRGLAWAADHTAEAQAQRLIDRLQEEFPGLAWPN